MNLLSNYTSRQPVTQAQQRSLSHPLRQRGRQDRADSIKRKIYSIFVPPFPNLVSEIQSYSLNGSQPAVKGPAAPF